MPLVMNNDFAADGVTVGGTWTRQTPLVFQLGEQNAHISANGTYKIIQKPSAGQCPEEKSTCVQLSPPATVCPAAGHYIHIVSPARPLSLLPLRMLSHNSFSLPWRCRCAPTATVLVGKGAGHLCSSITMQSCLIYPWFRKPLSSAHAATYIPMWCVGAGI